LLPKGLKFAYVVIVMASAMIAFITLRGHDELATAGSSFVLQVDKPDDGVGALQVADAVEGFAREHRINVGRLYDDPLDVSERSLFLTVGDTSATSSTWINSDYPGFSPEVKLTVRPYHQARTLTADGTYLVYGSRQQGHALLQMFNNLGYQSVLTPVPSLRAQLGTLGTGVLTTFVLAIVLVIVVTVASSVLLNARFYGIQRLHGRSPANLVGGDFRRVLLLAAVVVLAVNLVLALPLYRYNDFHQFGAFLRVELVIVGALAALALVVQGLTVILLQRRPILEAVGGRVSAVWAFAGSFVLRGWSLLLVLSILPSGLTALWTLDDARAAYRTWAAAGDAYYLRMSAAIEYAKDSAEIGSRIGQALRKADERGEVTIAARHALTGSKHDILLVNERYLGQHDVRDLSGARVTPSATAQLLIPARYRAQAARIEDELPRWAAVALRGTKPEVRAEPIRDGQSLMFSTNGTGDRTPLLRDPVVLVAPAASGIIADDEYTTMATNGGILVQNPEQTMHVLSDAGLGDYVLGVTPFAHDAGQRYLEARRDAAIQLINLIIGAALLVFTAVAVAFVYCGRNAQSLFARHLHGWGFVRTHWRILALEATLGAVLLAWTWSESAAIIARSRIPTLPPLPTYVVERATWQPVLAGGVMLTALVLAAGAVRWLSPRKEIR
jgi:hypothetical protein